MKTDDGYPVILYVSPRLAGLMPAGKIREGQRYTMVGRLQRRQGQAGLGVVAIQLRSHLSGGGRDGDRGVAPRSAQRAEQVDLRESNVARPGSVLRFRQREGALGI